VTVAPELKRADADPTTFIHDPVVPDAD